MGRVFSGSDKFCPLCLIISFYLYGYGRLLLHATKPYLRVNYLIDIFCIRCHKINLEEFNISRGTVLRPWVIKSHHFLHLYVEV